MRWFLSGRSASRRTNSSVRTPLGVTALESREVPAAGLVISEIYTNPSGNDSPYEHVELVATRDINFASTPFSVVFTSGSGTTSGWAAGGTTSYGFNIASGSVKAGDIVYVGGSSSAVSGPMIRSKNTGSSSGDGFGSAMKDGVLGNGGSNADGVAVFAKAITAVTSSTVPDDAVFFGSAVGSAYYTSTAGFQLPVNDMYSGGKLRSTSRLALDPGTGQRINGDGTYDAASGVWTTARTWSLKSGPAGANTGINLSGAAINTAPTITPSVTGPITAAIGDPASPTFTFTVADAQTAAGALSVTASSSKSSVVPFANLTLTNLGNGQWRLALNPTGVGYSNITVSVSDGALGASYTFQYAVSTAGAVNTRWHSGAAEASAAIAVDANYMFVADNEDQSIRLYDRNNSGAPVAAFDFTNRLGLTDMNGGVPREVDIEAATRSGNTLYWMGSMSNSDSGSSRPNRNRIFATTLTGTGASATLTYVGRYDFLKQDLINWDKSGGHGLGANYLGLNTSSSNDPKTASGFNIEGVTMVPGSSTAAYIGFRTPFLPTTSRTKALVVPVLNFTTLASSNGAQGSAVFGTPILLDLGGRGIRDMATSADGKILIVAGPAGGAGSAPNDFKLFIWDGVATHAPKVLAANLSVAGLSPEAIVQPPPGVWGSSTQVQLLSDNGDQVYYGDGVAAQDLAEQKLKKFRSDWLTFGNANGGFSW